MITKHNPFEKSVTVLDKLNQIAPMYDQMPKIVVLRGNSGCGKSTVAKAFQKRLGEGTFLISQDYVRRDMLFVKDRPNNQAIELLKNLVTYGHKNCALTILEGIFYSDYYEGLFTLVKDLYASQVFAYYFDVPFEETLERHKQKPNSHEFGAVEMKRWWRDKDHLPDICEKIIHKDTSADRVVEQIFQDIKSSVI